MTSPPDYPSLADTVGNTPLVRLQRLPGTTSNVVLGKMEGNNPAGSVKDRPALSMIVEAERRGEIRPGDTLIEPTSGNTGIALAMVAAMRGFRMVLIMPDNLSIERRQAMTAYGAELILTPKAGGMEGARDLAEQMVRAGRGRMLDQFANPDNPLSHYRGTGPEIWRQTEGRITHFVSAMGTTGTIMGVSRFLKEQRSDIVVVGAQPAEGASIPGIRKWPEAYLPRIYDASRVDRVESVTQVEAETMTRRLATEEGIFCGMSAGGACAVALRIAQEVEHATIVFIVCDRGDRYLSTGVFQDDCSRGNGPARRRRMATLLVFDIETVPDVAGIRRTHDVPADLADADVLAWFANMRRAATGSDFAPIHLHKVVAIGCALRDGARFKIASVGELGDDEPELIRRFFEIIDRFDAPARHVERQRLRPAGAAPPCADPRRHGRALLGLGRRRPRVPLQQLPVALPHAPHRPDGRARRSSSPAPMRGLDAMSRLCGFPGKLGMDGSEVAGAVAAGRLAEVRDYCETDVLNTYLLYQRFRLMRGEIDAGDYAAEVSLARERIASTGAPHWTGLPRGLGRQRRVTAAPAPATPS